jgi:hypothetical protein
MVQDMCYPQKLWVTRQRACQNLKANSSGFDSYRNLESLVTITSCAAQGAHLQVAAPGHHVGPRHVAERQRVHNPGVVHESFDVVPISAARLLVVDVGELGQTEWHIGQLVKGDGTQWPRRRRGRYQLVGNLQIV